MNTDQSPPLPLGVGLGLRSVPVPWTRDELGWVALLCVCPLAEIASYCFYPSGWARLYWINAAQTFASLLCWLLVRRLARTGTGETARSPFW